MSIRSASASNATGSVVRDIVFAQRPGFRPLSLDLHLPADSPQMVVLFLHGGGWRLGSRRVFCVGVSETDSFQRLTAAGIAVVAADYRLSGEATFPAQLEDVQSALEWVRVESGAWGLSGLPVVAWGESAGGHLAALLGVSAGNNLAGVIDWYGASDLVEFGSDLHPEDPKQWYADADTREATLLGGTITKLHDLADKASPARHVNATAPPFLIAHGLLDSNVPLRQSERLASALEDAGVPVSLHLVDGAAHMWKGLDDTKPLFDEGIAWALGLAKD